jgi:hypothetical protein
MVCFKYMNSKQLKIICKYKKIKNYSKLKKNELVLILEKLYASIKIQRLFRNYINNEVCPISLEVIKYPCFAFKPKGFTNFIYYNLEPLAKYLINSGDFRDPKTREPYSQDNLKKIDDLIKYNSLKIKSVYKSSMNSSIYKRKREREEDILVIERCIDEIVFSMRLIMETDSNNDPTVTLGSFHFPTFHRYFRNLLNKSHEFSKQLLNNIINIITGPEQKPTPDPNNVKDFILQFLFTLESTYFMT